MNTLVVGSLNPDLTEPVDNQLHDTSDPGSPTQAGSAQAGSSKSPTPHPLPPQPLTSGVSVWDKTLTLKCHSVNSPALYVTVCKSCQSYYSDQ